MSAAKTTSTVTTSPAQEAYRRYVTGATSPAARQLPRRAPMVLLALLLLGTFSVTHAAPFPPGSFATTTVALNFRAGPSINYTVLQVLPPGTQLSIQNGPYNGAWYHARYGDRLGYVHGAYLTATSDSSTAPTLVGAGDIMDCGLQSDEATAALLDRIPGTVFTLGDHVHPTASAHAFAQCYEPSWGRHKARTRPTPGNHDYAIPGAAAYFDYFGAAAGDPSKGYYSYNLGTWHIIVLNSACNTVGCEAGSPQEQWLRADLAAHPATCTLAYWHHPLFSSRYGTDTRSQPLWQALYDAGADVVLNGHAHTYERFAPQTPHGQRDDARGIRAFIVGTGGAPLRPFATNQPHSDVRNNSTHGVLKLTLLATSYDWQFIPVAGQTFTDVGSAACH